jgi:hypothetical protein
MAHVAVMLFFCHGCTNPMADDSLTIDDRRNAGYESTLGGTWRLITDAVMGGESSGNLSLDRVDNRPCLRLHGNVSLENKGGFIQAALDVGGTIASDASGYQGMVLEVYGNDQHYNVHLRTADVWLPWQAYRASFLAPSRWRAIYVPFEAFTGYRIGKKLNLGRLERIGLVAIGRAFTADLCIAKLAFYADR